MNVENARRFKFGKKKKKKKPNGDIPMEPNGVKPTFGDTYAVVDARFDRDEDYIDHLKEQIGKNGFL